ncbi:MAG: Hpt domain-containing protein, partial [Oligoflexales bacterium]|nr:Hpt domain-containing protein [Oligoflexales bacterium]
YCGIIGSLKRYRPAYFYTLAWLFLCIGTFIQGLYQLLNRGSSILTSSSILTGAVFEAIFISLALAERIKTIQKEKNAVMENLSQARREKDEANLRLIEVRKENIRILDSLVQEKTHEIKTMLKNIKQGIFTLYENDYESGLISPDYSQHLMEIVENSDLSGKNFVETILKNTNLSDDRKSIIQATICASFGMDDLMFDLNSPNLIKEFEKYFENGRKKIIKIDWSPILDPAISTVAKILITMRDITLMRELESKNMLHYEELDYISEIISIPEDQFATFVIMTREFLDENRRLLSRMKIRDEGMLGTLFINMHTIKGNARALGLNRITSSVHRVEQYYVSLKNNKNENLDPLRLVEDLSTIETILEKYVSISVNRLSRRLDKSKIQIDRSFILRKIEEIEAVINHFQIKKDRNILREIQTDLIKTISLSTDLLFDELLEDCRRLSRDFKKIEPQLSVRGDTFYMTELAYQTLKNVFLHIFRNSLEHGIESDEDRVSAGKQSAGRIEIEIAMLDKYLQISCTDDGRGLAISALKNLVINQKKNLEENLTDTGAVANLIFVDGISTIRLTNRMSMRGIGMGAARNFLEKIGGNLEIKLEGESRNIEMNQPFKVLIMLPLKEIHHPHLYPK